MHLGLLGNFPPNQQGVNSNMNDSVPMAMMETMLNIMNSNMNNPMTASMSENLKNSMAASMNSNINNTKVLPMNTMPMDMINSNMNNPMAPPRNSMPMDMINSNMNTSMAPHRNSMPMNMINSNMAVGSIPMDRGNSRINNEAQMPGEMVGGGMPMDMQRMNRDALIADNMETVQEMISQMGARPSMPVINEARSLINDMKNLMDPSTHRHQVQMMQDTEKVLNEKENLLRNQEALNFNTNRSVDDEQRSNRRSGSHQPYMSDPFFAGNQDLPNNGDNAFNQPGNFNSGIDNLKSMNNHMRGPDSNLQGQMNFMGDMNNMNYDNMNPWDNTNDVSFNSGDGNFDNRRNNANQGRRPALLTTPLEDQHMNNGRFKTPATIVGANLNRDPSSSRDIHRPFVRRDGGPVNEFQRHSGIHLVKMLT